MKILWIYLCIVINISPFAVLATAEFEKEVQDEKKCGSNLVPYQITTSFGPKTICAYISPKRLTWDDAKFRCNLLFTQLIQQIHFKSSLRIELLNKGIDSIWMGIRRRNNFFVTEYPSKLFREADSFSPDYFGYHWSEGEPGVNDCVAVNITNGSLQTRICGDILPFVCADDGKEISSIYENLACPEGWNLSFALSSSGRTCVSIQKPDMHENAEKICVENDGQVTTFKEFNILSNSKFLSSMNAEDFWIKKRNFQLCEVTRNINGYFSKTFPTSCTLKYPFICVKHYKKASIEVRLSPTSIQPMQSGSKDSTDLLKCELETEVSEMNVESELWFQWYKDGLPISVNSPVIRLSLIDDALKRDPYVWDIASRQGYYYCKVQLPGSNETYFSPKMKFFYSDIATYVVEIRGIKQTNELDYSHQQFFDYMDSLEEASMSTVLEKVKFRYPEAEWDFMSKSILNGDAVLKIVVYIYKSDIEDFDERMACEELKDAFGELHSVPVFMESISVYINCEEFPIRNGYVQVIKSLKNIEAKLNRMEDTQELILEKLQNCDKSRNIESASDNNDFDVEIFLKAVEELKNLQNDRLHKTPDDENSENDHNQREENEFEDNFFSRGRKRFFGKSNEPSRPKDIIPDSKTHNFVEELDENYIQNPGKEWHEIKPNKVVSKKDL